MPRRYDASTKAKAIRLVREHAGDYPAEYATITAVAGLWVPATLPRPLTWCLLLDRGRGSSGSGCACVLTSL
jgi:hypothetical protein